MKYVYIDTFIIENFVMNYVILHITSEILRTKTRWYRLVAGSAIGVACAVASLWVESFFTALLSKIIISIIMIFASMVAIKKQNKTYMLKMFVKAVVVFYMVTFVFAGASFCLLISGKIKNMARYITGLSIAYITITGFVKIFKNRRMELSYKTSIYINFDKQIDKGKWISAIVDTGNSLKDPFSGKSVVVAEIDALKDILPKEIMNFLYETTEENIFFVTTDNYLEKGWKNRFRIIPYNTVGKEDGILPGFKADIIKIDKNRYGEDELQKENKVITLNDVIICFYSKTLSEDGSYSALLSPDMVA